MPSTIRILGRTDMRRAITMLQAIELMRGAFQTISDGTAVAPQRLSIEMTAREGRALLMPVYMPDNARFGTKLVTLYKNNPSAGLPYIHSMFLLVDAADGHPLSLMDGEFLTALRTGAASGLATEMLSKKDSSTAVIIGAGAQGRFQLEGVCAARPITKAFVLDRHVERSEAFCREMTGRVACELVPSSDPCVIREADVICTATTSTVPVFNDRDLRPGTHINAVGAYRPDMKEVPVATVLCSTLVVDSRESCRLEAGDLMSAFREGSDWTKGLAELGEIVTGKREGRTSDGEITVFKSVGNAVQDLVTAARIFEIASAAGWGAEAEL
jgi:ornithine cyclodeaminase/alanine dehydrogenase-like protein (mu-crystallin family)